jgi:hypothetical protein
VYRAGSSFVLQHNVNNYIHDAQTALTDALGR